MKAREIRELGAEETSRRERELRQELLTLKLKHSAEDGSDNPVRMRALRRDIARLATVQREREASR